MAKSLSLVVIALPVLLMSALGQAETQAIAREGIIPLGFSHFDAKKGVPFGWELDRKSGKPVLQPEKDEAGLCLTMISDDQSSFGINRPVKVNVKEYPFLNWKWKAGKLPLGADIRKAEKDDQAAQIYVAFTATGLPARLNTPVLGYIWDNEVPKGWTGRSPQFGAGKFRYIVIRNKTDKLGEWYTEKRNLYRDYQKMFKDMQGGEPAGPIQGISLYINSQHTRSSAESCIGNIYLSRQ